MTPRSILLVILQPQQRLLAFAVAVLLACVTPVAHGGLSNVIALLSLSAIVIAIGHGAFDGVLARPLFRPHFPKAWFLVFAACYLVSMALVALLWCLAPRVAMCAFLLYSAWHFGTEGISPHQAKHLYIPGWCAGFIPIAAACYWHPASVTPIFAVMIRANVASAASLTHAAGLLLIPSAAIAIFLGTTGTSGGAMHRFTLTLLELMLFWRCEPLLAFAIFFCLWHAPEHLVTTSTSPAGRLSICKMSLQLRSGLGPWLASLALLVVLITLGKHHVALYAAQVFLLLSALTVPHMTLNEARHFHLRAQSLSVGGLHAR